jgi:putative membrane-bound dehydrogenase-like protein
VTRTFFALVAALFVSSTSAADGNRLAYLDDPSPYYPNLKFPKLITPQWVGEAGVDAVVILAIDDMRGPEKWEAFLRPVLERLKKIDSRAPVSIMTCQIDPKDAHLQKWLKEGVSLETHTVDHPCPLFRKGDFAAAKASYEKCVDLLAEVPNSRPVAFRTPCCDSLNTVSPRFFSEIFNKTTAKGNFLQIDSSVFTWFTPNDPALPRDLVYDKDGRMRFAKYLPADRTFVNVIEDYPYPYVVNRLCWEFPCMTPSDWQAQHLLGPGNPKLLEDWKAALDATVIKQGVFTFVFHPYGWSRNEQLVDFIDYAQTKYGKRVKFLNFREALERLNKRLLMGLALRDLKSGSDMQIRVYDFNNNGFMDVVFEEAKRAFVWLPIKNGIWEFEDVPAHKDAWQFRVGERTFALNVKNGVGVCSETFKKGESKPLPFSLPEGAHLSSKPGEETGLRFADLDGDGKLDVIFSDENGFGVYLFENMEKGWSRKVLAGKRGDPGEIPPIAVKGMNNGAWIAGRHIYWQNETTDKLKDLIDHRSFSELVADVSDGPRDPEASRKLIEVRKGFEVELVAAEPLVQSPIAFAWGADGKLWVVEMGDYPLGLDGKGKPGGKIKFLESTKNDGKYDKATVFLDGLPFPTGVLPWRKGVLVTCAPDIFYAEDTDGDGKADVKKVLFTGFAEGNQQHRVNTLAWGLDNWVHVANGDSGGRVKSLATGKTLNLGGRDLRIRPDTGEMELEAGQTQYGRCRTDWGDWFGNNNSNPLWHVAVDDHYLRRNPHTAAPPPTLPVPEVPGAAPVFPISRTLPRFNDPGAANRFTSACSPTIYRDDLFGPQFAGSVFVSEPVHNLIHREVMTAKGATFTSKRAADEQRSEFLASADNWFRPTMIATGPDGGLWVADMYRQVIEHPQWIPLDWQKKLDLRAGHDKGRIYRVVPVGVKRRAIPRLDELRAKDLVAALDSPSGWQRDTVQQLLIEHWRKGKKWLEIDPGLDAISKPLEKMALESKNPLARLHALCTLDGMDALRPAVVAAALGDEHPSVVRHAVRLCEGRFKDSDLGAKLAGLTKHPDPHVRLQLAYTLGEWDSPDAGKPLAELARAAGNDRYLLAAALSSLNARNFAAVAGATLNDAAPPAALLEGLLAYAVGSDDRANLARLIGAIAADGAPTVRSMEALAALLDALERRRLSVAALAKSGDETMKAALAKVAPVFAQARTLMKSDGAKPADVEAALRLLGRGPEGPGDDLKLIASLLAPQVPGEVQSAAVAALARFNIAEVPGLLLKQWKGYTPAVRSQVLAAMLSRNAWVAALLDAVAKGQVLPAEIDAASRQRLLTHADWSVRAGKLLAGSIDADRQKVIDAYGPALSKAGDRERGKQIFVKTCAACHRLGEVGTGLGPDLTALTDKSADYLLTNILDPNRAIEARYLSYTAMLKDGTQRVGFLAAETATGITLVGPDGKQQSILRTEIDELRGSGKSVMPEGIEKDISVAQMADLLAFLRASLPAAKRKEFPGNSPEVVRSGTDGVLVLPATACSIFGKTLVFEAGHKNLGFWGSTDDAASWAVAVPTAGKYDVTLDWACDANNAGNTFVLEAGAAKLTGKIESTGSWEVYRQAKIGTLEMVAGEQRVTLKSQGPIRGYLLDLRSLKLVPAKK